MAKQVREEVFIMRFKVTRSGGIGQAEVSCDCDYEVTSEDLKETRVYYPELTGGQVNAAKGLAQAILQKIKQIEES